VREVQPVAAIEDRLFGSDGGVTARIAAEVAAHIRARL
jgi:hypothetical protein